MIRPFFLLIALLLTFPAAAHQQKTSISIISHNPRTEMLEIVHRVPLHDAEHALRSRGVQAADVLSNVESRRAFALYVAECFQVSSDAGAIDLTLLGTEIEGATLLVYQEAPSPGPGATLNIQSQILTDVWARQTNRVNLGSGTSVDTLVFRSADRPKTAVLP